MSKARLVKNAPKRFCSRSGAVPVKPSPKVRRFVRMFQPRFAFLVESGAKWCTIRAVPKRMPAVGDLLSLREWCGKPYRSEQRVLCESEVTCVESILITEKNMVLRGGAWLTGEQLEDLAWSDGFLNPCEFFEFFDKGYGLPFEGIVLHWKWRKAP